MLLILAGWGLSGIYFAAYDLYAWWDQRERVAGASGPVAGNRSAPGGVGAVRPAAPNRTQRAVASPRAPGVAVKRRAGALPVAAAIQRAEAAARDGGGSPAIRGLGYRWVGDRPMFEIAFDGPPHVVLLDADTGALLSPVTPELARAIAVDTVGGSPPVIDLERRTAYSLHYFRNASYRSSAPRDGTVPYYLVWLGDPGRTLVVVSEASGQVLLERDLAKRMYWYGYWFLHTYLFHPSRTGQLVSDLLLLIVGTTALVGAVTGMYLYVHDRVVRRRSRRAAAEWRASAVATK